MRTAFSLALCLACAAASAAITVLPGSTPQEAPAGIPFPNQIAVLATDANGNPQRGVSVGFNLPLFNGPQMDANPAAFSCFPDLGLNCYAVTDSNGVAILPGFYGNGVHEYLVYVGGTALSLATYNGTRGPFKSLQDMWWSGAVENGWGMSVVEHGAQLFNVIYAYDAEGKPTWWVMPTGEWNRGYTSYTSYAGDVYSPRSSPYFAYEASRLAPGAAAGRLTLEFDGRDAAMLTGAFGASSVQKSIVRMPISPDVPGDAHGVGDMWWGGESQNGWGVAILERDGALFCVWLTYDAGGKPTWFVMPGGTWLDARTYSGALLHTTGSPWLGGPYDPSRLKIAASGTYALRFTDARHATLEYAIDGRSGSLALVRQPF